MSNRKNKTPPKRKRKIETTRTVRIGKDLYDFLKTFYQDPMKDSMDVVIRRLLPHPKDIMEREVWYAVGSILFKDEATAKVMSDVKGERVWRLQTLRE